MNDPTPKILTPDRRTLMRSAIVALLAIVSFTALRTTVFGQGSSDDDMRQSVKRAMKLTRNGEYGEADKLLREVLAADPKRPDANIELAFNFVKQRRLVQAYDLVYPVAEADPKNARAIAVLGAVLLNAGRFTEARAFFHRSVEIDRSQDLAWAGYGLLEFYENRITEAVRDLRTAVYIKPNEPDYHFALAQISSRAENYKEAADSYSRFLECSNRTDTDRRDRIKGLITFLKFLGSRSELYRVSGSERTTVSVELVRDRPVISIKVNELPDKLRFVLDTGSGISVISAKAAKAIGIKEVTRGGYAKGLGGDGRFQIVYGFLREIGIGDVSIRNVPVYIREFQSVRNDGAVNEVDGYIGLSLISKFLTTIDYGNKTFALTRRDIDVDEPTKTDTSDSLPLRLTSSGFLSGEVALDGIEDSLNFIVDTGASVSVISNRVAGSEMIKKTLSDEKHRVIGSAGITDDVPSFLLPRVTFGPNSRTSILAIALNLDIINEAAGFEQAGILGGNFLKNYRLTFDFKNSRVTFTPVVQQD